LIACEQGIAEILMRLRLTVRMAEAAGFSGTLAVVRLWQDGTIDTTFGNGVAGAYVMPGGSSFAKSIALAANGDIILGGSLGNQGLVVAVRPDGSGLDGSFGGTSSGVTLVNVNGDISNTTSIGDLKLNASDAIYVTGTYNGSGHQQVMLALLGPDGSLLKADASDIGADMGNDGDQIATALALQPDGKLFVAGYVFYQPQSSYACLLARYIVTLDGGGWHFLPDGSYGSQGRGELFQGNTGNCFNDALALLPDGSAIGAGRIFDANEWTTQAYQVNGAGAISNIFAGYPVTRFGDNSIRHVLVQPNGEIILTGFSGWNDGQGDSGSGYFSARAMPGLSGLDPDYATSGSRFFMFDERATSNDQSFGAALDRYGRVVIAGFTQYGRTNPDCPVMGVTRLTSDLIFENGFELHE
jgi:hypothetical protein